jgi:hypothetical protein
MGSPWDVATVPTRHLRDVIGSGVCYLGRDVLTVLEVKAAVPDSMIELCGESITSS